ncbi:MAG: glycerol kinase GlpK [Actinobacteria bacterium]|nr:glycerol kinase GlpK [Actinomycetota bacterium]MBW3650954.1 glycerol kinase GlpK [Actinomycetota bacterium]
MGVVVAIDAGTTGVRALAVDEAGQPVAWSYREFPQHFPRPGWVEHDPMEIWAAVVTTLAELNGGLDQQIAAIGITDQRETAVLWDRRTGAPLAPAIVWQDRRTATRCDQLREQGALPEVRARTGLVLDPYFSATKVEWLLTEGGVARGPDLAFGTVDSWLLWNLTGGAVHATDPSNASRTLLFDINTLEWSQELCDLFGVPPACLPEVRPSSGRFGTTVAGAGLPAGVPVSGIAGDQQAALFGQACFTPGMTKNTYGTGSFVLMNVGPRCPEPEEGLLTTVGWVLGDGTTAYALEGAIFATGSAVQWLRDGLGIIGDAAEVGPLAATVPDNQGVYLVPAFTGLGSPWWDPYARGTVVGLTRGAGRAHLARAVVEAMAYQTRDVVEAMSRAAGRRVETLRVDGGASVMNLLLQIQADQLQVPVSRPRVAETTAMGAAFLAGLAEGLWSSLDEVASHWALDARFDPKVSPAAADGRYAGWQRAVERARHWAAPAASGELRAP